MRPLRANEQRASKDARAQARQYVIDHMSEQQFALAFKKDGEKPVFKSLSGCKLSSDKPPDTQMLAFYDHARAGANTFRAKGEDVDLAVYVLTDLASGWVSFPTWYNPRTEAQAKPFTPFADEATPSESFPIESLREPYRAYIKAASGSYQVDAAMVACCVLATLSAIFQRCGFEVRVTPDWAEPVNLFLICTASPSERKSPVLGDSTRSLTATVGAWNEGNADAIAWQTQRIEVLRRKVEDLTTQLAKGRKSASESDLRQAQSELRTAEREQLKPQTWLVDDTTPEALALVLKENGESAALLSGEGGSVLGILAGRYSAPGSSANLDLFLKAYSVEPTVIHRIGRQTVSLMHPRLTVLLMAQPSLLRDFVGNDTFSGRGLCARFLYSFPQSQIGHRAFYSEPIPEDVRAAYESKIRKLADLALNWQLEDTTLTVSTDALTVLGEFHDEVEPTRPGMSDAMQAWSGKIEGNVIRIAALLYLSEHDGKPGEIDADTMRRAVEIGKYFQTQAQYALGLFSDTPTRKSALLILRKIESPAFKQHRLDGYVRKRDLYLSLRGKDFKSVSDLDSGLRELESSGYIVITTDETSEPGRSGRPSPKVFFASDYLESLGEQ